MLLKRCLLLKRLNLRQGGNEVIPSSIGHWHYHKDWGISWRKHSITHSDAKNKNIPVPEHLMETPLFKPIPTQRSVKISQPKRKAPSKIQGRLCSRRISATIPQCMRIRYAPFATRRTTNNQCEHKRPFSGAKRPRSSPAEGSYCRAAERFRYTDVEPVKGVKWPRYLLLGDSAQPAAVTRRCARTVVRNSAPLLRGKESGRKDMSGIKWNHRRPYTKLARKKK